MPDLFKVKKVAVLGSGVMGAQIAAHFVNAGFNVIIFDLKSSSGKGLAQAAVANLAKLKPSPWGFSAGKDCLQAKNYEDDLQELLSCSLVIEAIAERLDWKEDLYRRIAPYLHKEAILVSNTSGLSINTLAEVLPVELQERFCGVHFFNPPRYMPLVELIPSEKTSPHLLSFLETFLTSFLGKGVVVAKDTPNFIANRIGVFSLLATLHHAQVMGIGLDTVDALTGTLIGRPKSATCRTMDVVGLDTMAHVVNTMKEKLKDDPWHDLFHLPQWLTALIEKGHLGQKTQSGLYRQKGREIFDPNLNEYRPTDLSLSYELKSILSIIDPALRFQALRTAKDKEAQFLLAMYRDLFHYSSYHLAAIADNVADVDLALRWGFGWEQGPFELWQKVGVALGIDLIKESADQVGLPNWLNNERLFYTQEGAYSASREDYRQPVHHERQFFPQQPFRARRHLPKALFENSGVGLYPFREEVALLSFKTKANVIDQSVVEGLAFALEKAQSQCQGMIIYQDQAETFSLGADLSLLSRFVAEGKFTAVEKILQDFQQSLQGLKQASIPVIAALRGRALGGGCELVLHCTATVAAFESYIGLVEVGAGLIPAGGGCKELARRLALNSSEGKIFPTALQLTFQRVATGFVTQSAREAQELGLLKPDDLWVMNADEVLYAALVKIKALQAQNYKPSSILPFKIAGREGAARLKAGMINWLEGGFMTEHDYTIGSELASVLCGGELYQGSLVTEDWLLKLERQAFMRLIEHPLTQARMSSLLKQGKVLRN